MCTWQILDSSIDASTASSLIIGEMKTDTTCIAQGNVTYSAEGAASLSPTLEPPPQIPDMTWVMESLDSHSGRNTTNIVDTRPQMIESATCCRRFDGKKRSEDQVWGARREKMELDKRGTPCAWCCKTYVHVQLSIVSYTWHEKRRQCPFAFGTRPPLHRPEGQARSCEATRVSRTW